MSSKERLDNINPQLYDKIKERELTEADWDESVLDPFDTREIFDLVRDINDPEHPLTLEQLNVVTEEQISVDDPGSAVEVQFTPTIPHCSMATLIGLAIRVKAGNSAIAVNDGAKLISICKVLKMLRVVAQWSSVVTALPAHSVQGGRADSVGDAR